LIVPDRPKKQAAGAPPASARAGPLPEAFDSVESLYGALRLPGKAQERAAAILGLQGWLTAVSLGDPVTGRPRPMGLLEFLDQVSRTTTETIFEGELKDRVCRIVAHTLEAVRAILARPRVKILREHARLPIHAVRELDSACLQWLSRQPGRTFREKLAGKPYMRAVRRSSSFDTTENRLLKAFLLRLERTLEARRSLLPLFPAAYGETCEEMLGRLRRWLRTGPADDIGVWGNLPPNNTLLKDKNYKKIWAAWLWLRRLDENTARDGLNLQRDILKVIYWKTLALLNRTGRFRTVQQPLRFDYDIFGLEPSGPIRGRFFPQHGRPVIVNVKIELEAERLEMRVGEASLSLEIIHSRLILKPGNQGKQIEVKLNLSACDAVAEMAKSILVPAGVARETAPQELPGASFSVIDLCSVRPRISSDTAAPPVLPFRLLRQHWPEKYSEGEPLDCGEAKAIAWRQDTETVSMRSLFSPRSALSSPLKLGAAMFFAKKIKAYISTGSLAYLVPDWDDGFKFGFVRKSINSYFSDAEPIPRSIAAVFAWQSSGRFVQSYIDANDFVLVVDAFEGGLTISPVKAVRPEGLSEAVPETGGFAWELHPVFTVEDTRPPSGPADRPPRAKGSAAAEWLRLFGFDGLGPEVGALSLVADDEWHDLSDSDLAGLAKELEAPALSKQDFRDCMWSIYGGFHGKKVFILRLTETIPKIELGPSYCWLDSPGPLVEGARTLREWQKTTGIPLWKIHLPDLWMTIRQGRQGRYKDVDVFENAIVTPKRGGEDESITVKRTFTLPAGQYSYSFPLRQGKGKHKLRFAAHLESEQFPLPDATKCELSVTYNYWRDIPYEFKFRPIDAAGGGRPIRIVCRLLEDDAAADRDDFPAPGFPKPKTWEELQKYPKDPKNQKAGGTDDLLKRCIDGLRKLCDSLSKPVSDEELGRINSSLRFTVLTIWDNGRSLSDSGVPGYFQEAMREGIERALSIMESEKTPGPLKKDLFFFLCCLHGDDGDDGDAPGPVAEKLIKGVTDKKTSLEYLNEHRRNIAYSIGNAERTWQEKLLAGLVNQKNDDGLTQAIKMEILALAFWRSEKLVFKLKERQFNELCHGLYKCLEFDLKRVAQNKKKGDKGKYIALVRHLELLLALLRMRRDEDKNLKTLLAPGRKLTEDYVKLVDEATELFRSSDFELRSRINLQEVEKPEVDSDTPDLLYALRMYLTGDSGANSIWIADINIEKAPPGR